MTLHSSRDCFLHAIATFYVLLAYSSFLWQENVHQITLQMHIVEQ